MVDRVEKTNEQWKKQLSEQQYEVTRQKGTERAFTGEYWNNHEQGTYRCVCCGNDLFSSETKFDSGTGWPSFWEPVAKENVKTDDDYSLVMPRTEIECSRCGAHLGHGHSGEGGQRPPGPEGVAVRHRRGLLELRRHRR